MTIKLDQMIKNVSELTADRRSDALWLGGSYGRGDADAFSDFDFYVHAKTPGDATALYEDIGRRVSTRPDIVFSKTIPQSRTVNAIDQEWSRFDITVIDDSQLPTIVRNEVKFISGAENVASQMAETRPPKKAGPGDLVNTTNEFIRVLGLLPVALGREDYVLAQTGAQLLREMLVKVMLKENFNGVIRGVLSTRKGLDKTQYGVLQAIPPIHADKASLLACHGYLASAFLPRARKMYEAYQLQWPEAFEDATRKSMNSKLGINF